MSAIARRPLPPHRWGFVWFAWFADTATYERHRLGLEADPFWREVVAPGWRNSSPPSPGTMRRIIAAMQTSLDGYIEGPNGELDWVQSWEDPFDLLDKIDACIVGATTYVGYEQYWGAILEDPRATLPFSGRPPTAGEIAYAHFAGTTPHYVLSTTMSRADWDVTRIVRNVDEIRRLKELPGKDMHALGGAALVSSLLDAGLVDELRLVIVPVVLGRGKSLFTGVTQPRAIRFVRSEALASGVVRLTYDCTS